MKGKLKQKEPYEAPAVLDITPVTVNVVAGGGSEYYGDGGGDGENPTDDEG